MAKNLYAKARISGRLRANANFGQTVVEYADESKIYTGAYEITPGQSALTLDTRHKYMSEDVIINPIPSNYGLVTWDGAVLTVS